jgi:hypothetical protein
MHTKGRITIRFSLLISRFFWDLFRGREKTYRIYALGRSSDIHVCRPTNYGYGLLPAVFGAQYRDLIGRLRPWIADACGKRDPYIEEMGKAVFYPILYIRRNAVSGLDICPHQGPSSDVDNDRFTIVRSVHIGQFMFAGT